jgi:hypothetical protein
MLVELIYSIIQALSSLKRFGIYFFNAQTESAIQFRNNWCFLHKWDISN